MVVIFVVIYHGLPFITWIVTLKIGVSTYITKDKRYVPILGLIFFQCNKVLVVDPVYHGGDLCGDLHPGRLTAWNIIPWRFGSDHFPF